MSLSLKSLAILFCDITKPEENYIMSITHCEMSRHVFITMLLTNRVVLE